MLNRGSMRHIATAADGAELTFEIIWRPRFHCPEIPPLITLLPPIPFIWQDIFDWANMPFRRRPRLVLDAAGPFSTLLPKSAILPARILPGARFNFIHEAQMRHAPRRHLTF